MKNIRLSYIIATRNRLNFLKVTLKYLIENLGLEEEIVVVDGNSTDGAKEYLQQLFKQRKIHQFISEPDHNQAHGWNKALLMAKGIIIKKIIDDDVYDYKAIRNCADFMVENAGVDICISNCLSATLESPQHIHTESRASYYQKWKNKEIPCFTFSDVSMLTRRSSLSYLGLYDTQFAMMDWEYALRCSYLQANIAYYTGCNSLAVGTPGNVTSRTGADRLKMEEKIGREKYGYMGDRADISAYSEFKIAVGKLIKNRPIKDIPQVVDFQMPGAASLQEIYGQLYQHLEAYNSAGNFQFI